MKTKQYKRLKKYSNEVITHKKKVSGRRALLVTNYLKRTADPDFFKYKELVDKVNPDSKYVYVTPSNFIILDWNEFSFIHI